jgi:hypothetical protein
MQYFIEDSVQLIVLDCNDYLHPAMDNSGKDQLRYGRNDPQPDETPRKCVPLNATGSRRFASG